MPPFSLRGIVDVLGSQNSMATGLCGGDGNSAGRVPRPVNPRIIANALVEPSRAEIPDPGE